MKQLTHKVVYQNPWFRLWEDEVEFKDGSKGEYAYLDRIDSGAIIIPLDHEGNFYLLREFRYPVQTTIFAFPAGGREGDETNADAAKRELKEETGFVAGKWTCLHELFPDPAQNMQRINLFLAEDITGGEADHQQGETIKIHKTSLKEVKDRIAKGEPCSSQFLACLFLLELELSKRTLSKPPPSM